MKKSILLLLLTQLYTLFASDLLIKINYANHDDALEIARKNNLSVHHINLDYMLVKSNTESLTKINKLFNSVEILDNNTTSENYYIIPKSATQLKRTATASLDKDNYLIKNLSEDEYWSLKKELIKVNSISKEPITLSANKITRMPTLPKDEKIAALVEKVDQDSLRSYMLQLQNFKTRYAFALNRREVAVWIKNKFKSFGYENARLDSFQLAGKYLPNDPHQDWQYNVEASLTGTKYPENSLIIGGHHDCGPISNYDSYIDSPGADDNGSGTSAVLEIARILKQNGYTGQKSLKFCTWAAEEVGSGNKLSGSYQYAKKAKENQQNIELYINNDMVANYYTNWQVMLHGFTFSFSHRELASKIVKDYSSIDYIYAEKVKSSWAGGNYWPINMPGDGGSFFQNGFNAIYYAERDFPTNRYHEITDVVDSCNFPYFRETTRASMASLISFDQITPAPLNLQLTDLNNLSIKAEWNKINTTNIKGYKVYIGKNSGVYDTNFSTTENQYILTNLIDKQKYYIGISSIDQNDNESCINEATISLIDMPLAPRELKGLPTKTTINLNWCSNKELDLTGYNIYRSIDSLNFIKINTTAIKDTIFVDQNPDLTKFIFYKISAIDNINNESQFSEILKSHVISLDQGILVRMSMSSSKFKKYITKIAQPFSPLKVISNIDIFDINTISAYSTLILLDCNVSSNHQEYLNHGGNILLLGDIYLEKPLLQTYFGIDSVVTSSPNARCLGGQPQTSLFNKLTTDSTKALTWADYHLPNISTLKPTSEANVIYTYDSKYEANTEFGKDKGRVIGVKKITDTYKTVALTLPIDQLKESEAQAFMQTVLGEIFNEKVSLKEDLSLLPKETILLQNYPNPFNPTTQIEFSLAKEDFVNLSIYNVKGELVQELINQKLNTGKHNINFNGAGLNSGVYLYHLKTGTNSLTQKMVIVK